MKRRYSRLAQIAGKDPRVLKGVHIAGGSLCIMLCATMHWLRQQPNESASPSTPLPMAVEEAERLVSNASTWLDELELQSNRNRQLVDEAHRAVEWVPRTYDWQKTMAVIQDLAERCDLVTAGIRPGETQLGSRVKIHTASVQLEGTYESLCNFLDQLPKLAQPIWASEITIQTNPDQGPLAIVLQLRVPEAGDRTISAYLIGEFGSPLPMQAVSPVENPVTESPAKGTENG